MSDQPNPLRVALSILRARGKRPPRPMGSGIVDHRAFGPLLAALRHDGVPALVRRREEIHAYRSSLESANPDGLSRDEALAFWLNAYNAGALDLAAETMTIAGTTVLRIPGGFSRVWMTVDGEQLSLDDIEHGKIRRFGDPRIHAALVCGSASCPTLRFEPFAGHLVDQQLEEQMRSFLSNGGASVDAASGTLLLSRVFLWYGGDFTRPHRMPTWPPTSKRRLAAALSRWMPETSLDVSWRRVEFQDYDWGLACTVG